MLRLKRIWFGDYFITKDISRFLNRRTHFSLNDAALCVEKMGKLGKWKEFLHSAFNQCDRNEEMNMFGDGDINGENFFYDEDFIAWLLTMESGEAYNFFAAIAAWIEEKK